MTEIVKPKIRFRHFHQGVIQKGNLAGTAAYQDSIIDNCVDIGFVVANPNDKVLTRKSGRERAVELMMREPVTITSENFKYLSETGILYMFLCFTTNKRLKIALRNVL